MLKIEIGFDIYFKCLNFISEFSAFPSGGNDLENNEEQTAKSFSETKFTERQGIEIDLRNLEEEIEDKENASKAGVFGVASKT